MDKIMSTHMQLSHMQVAYYSNTILLCIIRIFFMVNSITYNTFLTNN